MSQNMNWTTPVGRLVRGSLYKGNTTDAENKPLVTKTGSNAGQPRVDYFFALAIPKGPEQGWWMTDWGQKIMGVGATAFPQAYQSPAFAWKITDGDSQVPNKKGRKPCDNEGYKGHWILSFSSGFAPKLYKKRDGTQDQFDPLPQPDFIKLGYYVQVNFNCGGNGSQTQPGVFLNHSMVAFAAFGTEISVGPDVNAAGFGQGALPAGASLTPPPGAFGQAAPGLLPQMGMGAGMPQMGMGAGMPQMGMGQPAAAMPQMGMGQPAMMQPAAAPLLPGFGAAPAGLPQMGMGQPAMLPSAAPATPQYQMAPQAVAQGLTREALNAQGYTDDALVNGGYMTRLPDAPVGLPQMGQPAMGMPQMGVGQPMPLSPGFSAPAAGGFAAPIAGAPGAQIPVIPNPQFVQMPPMGQQMAAPAAPQLTAKAQQMGATSWNDFVAQGWTEQAARAQQYIV